MKNDQLPEGFLAEREGDTVRVHLPEVVVTASHVLEPMLTRGAAQRLAEALWEADVDAPIEHVVLVHDRRIAEPAVAKFRERLLVLFIEGGVDAEIDVEVEREAAPEAADTVGAPAAPADPVPTTPASPPASAVASPAPPSAPTPDPAVKKTFAAPVPARRRVGTPRAERDEA